MREALAAEPSLAGRMIEPANAPLLAPLVHPPLTAEEAAGLDLILEGFLLHHGRPRLVAPEDRGREVLAGDYCYAHGLVRVARSGDLFVIAALSELIALSAGLVASGRREVLAPLWRATAVAIAAGDGPDGPAPERRAYDDATEALRAGGDADAVVRLARALPPTPELAAALGAEEAA